MEPTHVAPEKVKSELFAPEIVIPVTSTGDAFKLLTKIVIGRLVEFCATVPNWIGLGNTLMGTRAAWAPLQHKRNPSMADNDRKMRVI
jgi:hypothetical protein